MNILDWTTIPFGTPFEHEKKTLIATHCPCGKLPPCWVKLFEWTAELQLVIGDPSELPMVVLCDWLEECDAVLDIDLTDTATAALGGQSMAEFRLNEIRRRLLRMQARFAANVNDVLQRWGDNIYTPLVDAPDAFWEMLQESLLPQIVADEPDFADMELHEVPVNILAHDLATTVARHQLTVERLLDRFAPAQEPADGDWQGPVAEAMRGLATKYEGVVITGDRTVTMVIDLDAVRAAMAAEEAVE